MIDLFEKLKTAFGDPVAEPGDDDHALPRALAVLLLELAAADAGIDAAERRVIEQALADRFGLDGDTLGALLDEATKLQRDVHSMHEFTHALRTGLEPADRAAIVRWFWRVSYADGVLDRHEEHLVRRLADLLGVPHHEFMRQKHIAAGDG